MGTLFPEEVKRQSQVLKLPPEEKKRRVQALKRLMADKQRAFRETHVGMTLPVARDLAAIGVRRDGQKILLSIRNMDGESTSSTSQRPIGGPASG